jgi:uncharacterized protein
MVKKIVLDTNVLISAFGWEGNCRSLFRKIINNEFILILSHKQINEIKRVIDYPKFSFTNIQKDYFIKILYDNSKIIESFSYFNILEDKDDNIFLETAFDGNAEYIISGDKDLLKLKVFKNIKILSVKDFLNKFS